MYVSSTMSYSMSPTLVFTSQPFATMPSESNSSSSRAGHDAPPPLPPRRPLPSAPSPHPPTIQETPATPVLGFAPTLPTSASAYGLIPPPSPSFVPASPSIHQYPAQSGAASARNHTLSASVSDDAGLLPPPPAYSPTPQPGESTLPPDHSPLLPPAPIESSPSLSLTAMTDTMVLRHAADAVTDPSESIRAMISMLVPVLRSPATFLRPISPLPQLLYLSGSRLVLSPMLGSHLWHASAPANIHILTLPTPTSTLSVTLLPLIPLPDATNVLSTLVQVATALHMQQYYPNASLSGPSRDTVPIKCPGAPSPPWVRVCLNAELDNKKDARTGKTPRRTYVALHVPRGVLTREYVEAHGEDAVAGGAVLVVYADCFAGMMETNVVGLGVRAMVASGVVL